MDWYVKEDSVTPDEATGQLFCAVRSGNAEDAQAALTAGADVNARDDWQRTPLHCAIGEAHAGRTWLTGGSPSANQTPSPRSTQNAWLSSCG